MSKRRQKCRGSRRIWAGRGCLFFFCAVSLLALFEAYRKRDHFARFRRTQGKVHSVSHKPTGEAGGYRSPQKVAIETEVTVSFTVDGARYCEAPQVPEGHKAWWRGKEITVFYNPEAPEEFYLSPLSFPSTGGRAMFFGCTVLLWAVLESHWFLSGRKETSNTES